MNNELQKIKEEVIDRIKKIRKEIDINNLETKYLGRKGELTKILRNLKNLGEEQKRQMGKLANQIKGEIKNQIEEKREEIIGRFSSKDIDVSLPGPKTEIGHLNPLTIVQNELEELFISMGFMILDGPELESDYYCFEALNIPKNHPARDMQDTFYIDKKNEEGEYDLVMRTHTSPVQVRAMQKYGAPFRGVVPGRAFRNEAVDACHEHSFFQIECLFIDENISVANLKAVVGEMLSKIFEKDVTIRIRPGFFPFVEPGLEVDMSCTICGGKGCSSCKNTGWLEMGGAGMVHPNVLRAGNIDPDKYSGFAFGFGWDRLAMMKFGIADIRLFQSNNLKFLSQF